MIPEHGTEHVSEGLNNQLRLTNIKNFLSQTQWLVNKNFKNPYDSNYVLLILAHQEEVITNNGLLIFLN